MNGTPLSDAAWNAARAARAALADRPDAAASDPVHLGWMQGSPPPADKLVRFADSSRGRFPQLRWAFSHQRELIPTKRLWRGRDPVAALPRADRGDIDALRFTPLGNADGEGDMSWADSLAANYTDGIVVLHRGAIVYERYAGALEAHVPHIAMSVTKSFVGTLAASFIHHGVIDGEQVIGHYVPELRASAFGDATVRQVLDMRSALRYSEDYTDPDAGIAHFARAAGLSPRSAAHTGPDSIPGYLATVQKQGEHGDGFAYKTVNTDVIAWLLHRVTGRSIGQNLEAHYWTQLGVEEDAYLSVDSHGVEFAGGGLSACLRDLARFGEAMRCDGFFNGRQIVPPAVVAEVRAGGERGCCEQAGYAMLQGWSYRDMWWVTHNAHGAFAARGIHGQVIYVDPTAEMVIARFASHPGAANGFNDWVSLPAYQALAEALRR